MHRKAIYMNSSAFLGESAFTCSTCAVSIKLIALKMSDNESDSPFVKVKDLLNGNKLISYYQNLKVIHDII